MARVIAAMRITVRDHKTHTNPREPAVIARCGARLYLEESSVRGEPIAGRAARSMVWGPGTPRDARQIPPLVAWHTEGFAQGYVHELMYSSESDGTESS